MCDLHGQLPSAAVERKDYLHALAARLGADNFVVEDAASGWPAKCRIRVDGTWKAVAVHIGWVGSSKRGRDEVERRFQNPGNDWPVTIPPGYHPMLLGLQYAGKAIDTVVGMDPFIRLGRNTRFSMFVPVVTLEEASKRGWAEHTSASGEVIHVFHPELLPVFAEMKKPGVILLPEVPDVVAGSGLLEEPEDDDAAERARTAGTRLARKANFGRDVTEAYEGLCAMCELDADLIEGAHIYPVSAPGSVDRIWNGIALCPTHHRMFDRHLCYVRAGSREIVVSPTLTKAAASSAALAALMSVTRAVLHVPKKTTHRPRDEMFVKRYEYFPKSYEWAS